MKKNGATASMQPRGKEVVEWERSVRERCFVVVRCCDECFPFLPPLSHAGYPCVGASRGTGSLQAQSEHWHD